MNKKKQREINRLYQSKYRFNNKEKVNKINKLYRLNNKEKIAITKKKYYLKNKEKIKKYNKVYNKLYRLKNKQKISKIKSEHYLKNKYNIIKKIKLYRLNNPHTQRNLSAKRRALQLNATPKFANLNKIKEIYKNCPKGYHVDHIVPLQGKNVCGLHVEWNLQYLTPSENSAKSNKLINNYL
jgi:hypothetical protein